MPVKTGKKKVDLHEKAVEQFNSAFSACQDEREQALGDRRFYSIAGAQWEGKYGDQFAKRPQIEVNKVQLAVMRVINEYRNNRITVDFVSRTGADDEGLADVCDGLYRADELDSSSEEAYDNSFEEAAAGGFGAFRLVTEYEDPYDDEDDSLRIRFEPIYDADLTVYFDENAKKHDKSDARYCFVLSPMTRDAYEAEWGDSPESWDVPSSHRDFDWSTPDQVYVAEYYVVEEETYTVHKYRTIAGEIKRYTDDDFEDDPELDRRLSEVGTIEVDEKRAKRKRIRKYIMSGGGILEDCGYLVGSEIPVVPVYGKRWYVDGVERYMGVVRTAKDAQRLKNMQMSVLAEISSLTGYEKPIFTPEQVAGHEASWANDNIERYAYALINPIENLDGSETPAGPLGYTKPPQVPPVLAALMQISEGDIKDVLGNQEAGEEINTNLSGKGIELIQQRLDMQSFIYMSNFAKAIKRSGKIWLSMAKDAYVENGRRMKVVSKHGEASQVTVNDKSMIDPETGEIVEANDLKRAKFDVAVDVGPSSTSRRSATVRALTGMMQLTSDPADTKILAAAAMMNMDGEGLVDIREYFRKQLVQMGVVDPTDADKERMAQQQPGPDPQAQFLLTEAQKNMAQAEKTKADTARIVAQTKKTEAETAETLVGIESNQRQQVLQTVEALREAHPAPAPENGVR